MTKKEVIEKGLALIRWSEFAMVGTVDDDGSPTIRAMIRMEHTGLKEFWFTTNESSNKTAQLRKNPKACVYIVDFKKYEGLQLVGKIEVLCDKKSRQRIWRKGFERYYPMGVDDPDYCVLRFKAERGEYYHSLETKSFKL